MRPRLLAWYACVLTLAYLMPNHYPPWLSFHGELAAAVAAIPIVVWAVLRKSTVPALAMAGLGLALVPVLQVASGKLFYMGDGLIVALYLVGFALSVVAGARWATEERVSAPDSHGLTVFWMALLTAGYVSTMIALLQRLDIGAGGIYMVDLPPGGRPFGNLAQPNQLATLLLMAVAAHAALFESGKIRAGVALLGIVFLILGLNLTGSRTVLLALAWVWPAYLFLRRRCNLRTGPLALLGLTLVFASSGVLLKELQGALLLTVDLHQAADRLGQVGVRLAQWTSMLDAIAREPLLGYGWAQVGLAQTATALNYPAIHEQFLSAHNLFLDLLLWNGIPIGLLVIAGLVCWTAWQLRQVRDPIGGCILLTIGFVFSHAMVEYPLQYAYFLLPVGFLMGVLSAQNPSYADLALEKWTGSPKPYAFSGGMAVAALLMFAKVAVEYPFWEQDRQDLSFEQQRIGDPQRGELPSTIFLTQLAEPMATARFELTSNMASVDLMRMERATARFGDVSEMYRYAIALALNGRPDQARLTLRRLCHMHSVALCLGARRDWHGQSLEKYPGLKQVPFREGVDD